MTGTRRPRRAVPALVACLALAWATIGCGGPTPSTEEPAVPLVVGCISIDAAECTAVTRAILARLPPERSRPFAVEIELWGCNVPAVCPRSLAARQGTATVEFLDGSEPISLSLAGPPEQPTLDVEDASWFGPSNPVSPRVAGTGPFPYELGHCGLTWKVDFDGSFWLLVGQVDGDAAALGGNSRGELVLLAPNVAEYRGEDGFSARLARVPGPKYIWGCR